MPAYGPDLAAVHDASYSEPALRGARVLVAELERAGVTEGVVVDLGCGSGVSTEVLAAAGYRALGIDPSPAMLALAADRVPDALFKQGVAGEAELPRCVAVAAFGEPLNYVRSEDPAHADSDLAATFTRVHDALEPGGLFAFDPAGPDRGVPREAQRGWSDGDDWAVLVENLQTGTLLRRRIVTFRRGGGGWRRSEETHLQRLHPSERVLAELDEAGFDARVVTSWDERERAGHHAFLARRR